MKAIHRHQGGQITCQKGQKEAEEEGQEDQQEAHPKDDQLANIDEDAACRKQAR